MRGEDYRKSCKNTCVAETPPHAWGRRSYGQGLRLARRNTPTCVGKTPGMTFRSAPGEKHPHMRGEDFPKVTGRPKGRETPPHAWGRLRSRSYRPGLSQKHPHMRGEDLNNAKGTEFFMETPPHAWGRPTTRRTRFPPWRNTPTCVGKTLFAAASRASRRKHPHMRGEDDLPTSR